jgi:hypothetical protein
MCRINRPAHEASWQWLTILPPAGPLRRQPLVRRSIHRVSAGTTCAARSSRACWTTPARHAFRSPMCGPVIGQGERLRSVPDIISRSFQVRTAPSPIALSRGALGTSSAPHSNGPCVAGDRGPGRAHWWHSRASAAWDISGGSTRGASAIRSRLSRGGWRRSTKHGGGGPITRSTVCSRIPQSLCRSSAGPRRSSPQE